jgi:hypothetical protein
LHRAYATITRRQSSDLDPERGVEQVRENSPSMHEHRQGATMRFSFNAAVTHLNLLIALSLSLATQNALAGPTRADLLAWLEEYRSASEGPTPGTVLGQANIEELRPFLAPGFLTEFEFPEVAVGIEEPYHFEPPALYQEATAQHAGQTRLGSDRALENYTAGQPFSREQIETASPADAGFMVAWNHIQRWQYYGYLTPEMMINLVRPTAAGENGTLTAGLEGGGSVDRHMSMSYHRVYLSRLAMLPGQGYQVDVDDADRLLWKDYFEFLEPFDVKGTKFVVERAFADEGDQVNSYLPSERRVRRLSAKERADSFMGSDFTLDDFAVFSGRVFDFQWTYLGQKSILRVADSEHESARFFGPSSRVPRDRWQIRPCYVVELTPVWTDHPYASRIMFIDMETFEAAFASIFDRNGDLWKSLYTVVRAPHDRSGANAELENSVVRWRASISIDHLNNRGSVGIGQPVAHPKLSASKIRRTFDVSNLTSGR